MGTALLSIGVRAMAASYASMQTTSHNIANAGVEGYTRQSTNLATSQGQFTGVGFFGRGVDVVSVSRTQDAFLTREAATSKALASMDAARRDQLQQLELVFKSGEQGIGHSISSFFAAMSDLGSRPADGASREVVLARAQDMAMRFSEAGEQISLLQRSVNQEVSSAVQAVNTFAAGIAKVNNDIAAARGLGQQPNDLLDERDRLVSKLSEYVQVTTMEAEDGTLGVFMGGGQRLVLGGMAEELKMVPDTFDGARSGVAITEGGYTRPLTIATLGGGRIAGLLSFQSQDLVAAQTQLGQMSRAVAQAINEQQERGVNLRPMHDDGTGTLVRDPAQALFGFLDSSRARALPAATNDPASTASVTIVDATQLEATEYELRSSSTSSTGWVLRRMPADGSNDIEVSSGDVVNGMQVDFSGVSGDRFLLQPVTQAAIGMQRLLSDPLDVAAASPLVASTSSSNTGTVAVQALRMVRTATDVNATASITFGTASATVPGGRDYSWTLTDAGGAVIGGGSGTWTPGKPIPDTAAGDINGFELDVTGVPAENDVLTISPNLYPSTNNGNALTMVRLNTQSLVGRTVQADGSIEGGLSFNEAFVATLADIGVRTQGATSTATISAARAAQAETSRSDKAGVNLDEEAARLIQFQQGYQAAAKVLQIAQSVFSNLLDIAG